MAAGWVREGAVVLASPAVGRAAMVDPVTLADCVTPVSMAAVPAVLVAQGEEGGGARGAGPRGAGRPGSGASGGGFIDSTSVGRPMFSQPLAEVA